MENMETVVEQTANALAGTPEYSCAKCGAVAFVVPDQPIARGCEHTDSPVIAHCGGVAHGRGAMAGG